jgi:mycothiol synthase
VSRIRVEPAGDDARDLAEALDARVARELGHEALNDAVWRDLDAAGEDSAGFVARIADEPVGFVHVARSDTFAPRHWAVGAAVRPGADAADALAALLDAASDHAAHHGGGVAIVWRVEPDASDDAGCAAAGYDPQRDLLQMRVPLPLGLEAPMPRGYTLRTFEPGRDETAWLEVNNRAFRNHPEQGAWVAATLARRMSEPWFDPSIFLLAFDSEGLAGSNWLKVHPPAGGDPEIGEIFVIAVDPRAQGTGLGRGLAVAGLDLLAGRGIRVGMLYVDGANDPAVALYRSLGFTVHRHDRAYAREVAAS